MRTPRGSRMISDPIGDIANLVEKVAIRTAHCAPCKVDLPCQADGTLEYLQAGSGALDGDVKDSKAMTNHKLLRASKIGNIAEMRTMINRGAYLETRRPFIMTPETRISPNKLRTRGVGLTPLMYAAQGGYEEACRVLIEARADINAEEEDGQRPLHFAASSGCKETCKFLLSCRADLNIRDDENRVALDHVPPADAATPAEKRAWDAVLGKTVQAPDQPAAADRGVSANRGTATSPRSGPGNGNPSTSPRGPAAATSPRGPAPGKDYIAGSATSTHARSQQSVPSAVPKPKPAKPIDRLAISGEEKKGLLDLEADETDQNPAIEDLLSLDPEVPKKTHAPRTSMQTPTTAEVAAPSSSEADVIFDEDLMSFSM